MGRGRQAQTGRGRESAGAVHALPCAGPGRPPPTARRRLQAEPPCPPRAQQPRKLPGAARRRARCLARVACPESRLQPRPSLPPGQHRAPRCCRHTSHRWGAERRPLLPAGGGGVSGGRTTHCAWEGRGCRGGGPKAAAPKKRSPGGSEASQRPPGPPRPPARPLFACRVTPNTQKWWAGGPEAPRPACPPGQGRAGAPRAAALAEEGTRASRGATACSGSAPGRRAPGQAAPAPRHPETCYPHSPVCLPFNGAQEPNGRERNTGGLQGESLHTGGQGREARAAAGAAGAAGAGAGERGVTRRVTRPRSAPCCARCPPPSA
jgi:hypothetical protein